MVKLNHILERYCEPVEFIVIAELFLCNPNATMEVKL